MAKKIKDVIGSIVFMGRLRFSRLFLAWERMVVRAPEEKMTELCLQFAAVQSLEGDYLEFGTFWGASFVRAHHFAQLFDLRSMRFYAFDSFCGLPPASAGSVDDDPASLFSEGNFACSLTDFKKNLLKFRVDMEKVDIIPGWYRDTLTPVLRRQLPIRKAAVVWIDCDLYESTVPVLDFITPYMQDGTILMFDDWWAFKGRPDRGQPRAFAEWLARNPHITAVEYARTYWASMAFVVHVDSPASGAANPPAVEPA